MEQPIIRECTKAHVERYAEIFAAAFSGEPWNETWLSENALRHVGELFDRQQSYGLECVIDGKIIGFILGTYMQFHYGRTFEINDLAVDPQYQRRGIATTLLKQCLSELQQQDIKGIHLITASKGILPSFYEQFGFKKEERVILMGKEI